ncbi:ABC transporter substrate-binding protein [Anabaena cylindrica UHCC 0172]|uniref:ABC transporter substrate-binding protein n=1 Tax=Anabaena cylindrica TaxID=1165 RepID=UPI002B215FEC|nr:ABC transporter substrate-binding protein [Anabaena cylindrica]MEA5554214.1 ABC transporter substrate-binding protein [Anabaena cylindrica UHCC 0172]
MNILLTTLSKYNRWTSKFSTLFKRAFLISLLCLFFINLSGCQTSSVQKNDHVIQLTLWHGINPPNNRDIFNKLVNKFNQTHSDIQIESIYAGQLEQQIPKVLTAVVGNVPPDILFFNPQITGQLVEAGAIRSLEKWLDKSPVKSEIIPTCFDEMQLNGHTWSVPLFAGDIGIFYRRDLFQAAGIKEVPKTWEQLREVAKKLTIDKNGDHHPDQYGLLMPLGKSEWTVSMWYPFLFSSGGTVVKNNRPHLVNEQTIAALQFWKDLITDGSTKFSEPERGFEEDDFISGRVAMQLTGPWTFIMKSQVDYDVMPIPINLKPASVISSGNMFVMKTIAEREQAAWKFLEYIVSEEFQTEWSIGSGFLPVNIKSAQSQAYQEFIQQKPVMKVFLDQLSVSVGRPIISGYSRLSDSLGRAIEATMLGESPEKALQEAQRRLDLIWQ